MEALTDKTCGKIEATLVRYLGRVGGRNLYSSMRNFYFYLLLFLGGMRFSPSHCPLGDFRFYF